MNLSWRVKKIVSAPNPGLYRCTANEKSVNEVGRRGCCPVDFKDLRATITSGWAWLRRRVSVVVRTAIPVQRENGGRESDLTCLRLQRPLVLVSGVRRVADSFRSPCALTIQEMLRCSVDDAWHNATRLRERPGSEGVEFFILI